MAFRGKWPVALTRIAFFSSLIWSQMVAVSAFARPVSVDDVVGMNRIGSIVGLSPEGRALAVLLWRGNLEKGTNDYSLNLLGVTSMRNDVLVSLSTATNREAIASPRWLADGSGIVYIGARDDKLSQVFTVDVEEKKIRQMTRSNEDVLGYGVAAAADVIVYTTRGIPAGNEDELERLARAGFAVKPRQHLVDLLQGHWTAGGTIIASNWPGNRVYVGRGVSAAARLVYDGTKRGATLRSNASWEMTTVAVSPDGRYAVASPYQPPESSDHWERYSPGPKNSRLGLYTYALIDLQDGRIEPLLDAPKVWAEDFAVWSSDASKVTIWSYLPLAGDVSPEERAKRSKSGPRLVEVDIATRHFTEVDEAVSREVAKARIVQSLESPPEVALIHPDTGRSIVLTDLNPGFRKLTFGEVEKHAWKSAADIDCVGYLVRPVGYRRGVRYPVVFMAYPWGFSDDAFVMEGQFIRTAMAPQPLAGKGIASVLLKYNIPRDLGGVAEYELARDAIESAIRYFRDEGTIDEERLALVGWSRSTGHVKYTLANSRYRFSAATSADGVGGHYMYYAGVNNESNWMAHEHVWGDIPSAESKKFLAMDPALNAEKIRTPLLLSANGAPTLLGTWDLYARLRRLDRPVEFFYYPENIDEPRRSAQHNLLQPLMRQADLQRNVDWFSFWLKGEIDPSAGKRDQYQRWNALKTAATGK